MISIKAENYIKVKPTEIMNEDNYYYSPKADTIYSTKELLKRQSQNKFLTFKEKEILKRYEANKRKENKTKPKSKK